MSSLSYQANSLYFGKTKLEELLLKEKTPLYVYHLAGISERLNLFRENIPKNAAIHFAMKANANAKVLNLFQKESVGVDVVSAGEIQKALNAGFKPDQIIFSGVGKTIEEIELAIDQSIHQINIESAPELHRIGKIANKKQKKTKIAFRLNPDVDPKTHPYITTGFRENKFGMEEKCIPELLSALTLYPYLELTGLTMHIGSQIRTLEPFNAALDKMIPLFSSIRAQGFALKNFDVGGGLGIPYENAENNTETVALIKNYGKLLEKVAQIKDCKILCEPGRILVANFGILLAQVQYIKETSYKNFLILNTGMHHLVRPTLYQAYHQILPVCIFPDRKEINYDVVGPICESSDVLAKNRILNEIKADEYIAIADAGAYGFTMSSRYNEHDQPKEICI